MEDQVVARLYVRALLQIAQSELTPDEFDGLVSLYCRGGTISDAARALSTGTGRSFEAVRTHLRRAVEKMREIAGAEID
jgi:DNA-directed RNA polymerase specialized sigma24 family protein